MADFMCCVCGRAHDLKDYGTRLKGRFYDTVTPDTGIGTFVICRECWEKIETAAKAGMEKKGYEQGAFAIRCVTCAEALEIVNLMPQGTLVSGEHDNHRYYGYLRAPICPECWKRITRNIEADNVVVRDGS